MSIDDIEETLWPDKESAYIPEKQKKISYIEDVIQKMSPRDILILKLLFFKGLTMDEVSDFLQEKKDNLYVTKARAIKRLKKMISRNK